jgi:hypothetical protein
MGAIRRKEGAIEGNAADDALMVDQGGSADLQMGPICDIEEFGRRFSSGRVKG